MKRRSWIKNTGGLLLGGALPLVTGGAALRDKVVYNDVTYICNGAVSGAWWEGNRRQTAPGYGVIDFYADGGFEERYVVY